MESRISDAVVDLVRTHESTLQGIALPELFTVTLRNCTLRRLSLAFCRTTINEALFYLNYAIDCRPAQCDRYGCLDTQKQGCALGTWASFKLNFRRPLTCNLTRLHGRYHRPRQDQLKSAEIQVDHGPLRPMVDLPGSVPSLGHAPDLGQAPEVDHGPDRPMVNLDFGRL